MKEARRDLGRKLGEPLTSAMQGVLTGSRGRAQLISAGGQGHSRGTPRC